MKELKRSEQTIYDLFVDYANTITLDEAVSQHLIDLVDALVSEIQYNYSKRGRKTNAKV